MPLLAFAQAGVGVALGGQGGHGFAGHQFGHQLRQVEIGVPGVESRQVHEGGVAGHGVGQAGGAGQLRGLVGA